MAFFGTARKGQPVASSPRDAAERQGQSKLEAKSLGPVDVLCQQLRQMEGGGIYQVPKPRLEDLLTGAADDEAYTDILAENEAALFDEFSEWAVSLRLEEPEVLTAIDRLVQGQGRLAQARARAERNVATRKAETVRRDRGLNRAIKGGSIFSLGAITRFAGVLQQAHEGRKAQLNADTYATAARLYATMHEFILELDKEQPVIAAAIAAARTRAQADAAKRVAAFHESRLFNDLPDGYAHQLAAALIAGEPAEVSRQQTFRQLSALLAETDEEAGLSGDALYERLLEAASVPNPEDESLEQIMGRIASHHGQDGSAGWAMLLHHLGRDAFGTAPVVPHTREAGRQSEPMTVQILPQGVAGGIDVRDGQVQQAAYTAQGPRARISIGQVETNLPLTGFLPVREIAPALEASLVEANAYTLPSRARARAATLKQQARDTQSTRRPSGKADPASAPQQPKAEPVSSATATTDAATPGAKHPTGNGIATVEIETLRPVSSA